VQKQIGGNIEVCVKENDGRKHSISLYAGADGQKYSTSLRAGKRQAETQ
jgi:hypothetical protein